MPSLHLQERTQKILIAVFFAALTLIGLATSASYGISSDEHREIQTLRMHERKYLDTLLGSYNEFEKYFNSVGVYENYDEYADRTYGSALFYPVVPFLVIQKVSPFLKMVVWHCYNFLLFMLGCFALYGTVRNLFGRRVLAVAGMLLLYLSPRFFAEGHYNSKDVGMMVLLLLLFWQGLLMMDKPSWRRALLLGLTGAVITNQRVIGLLFWAMVCLFVLVYHLAHKTLNRKTVGMGVLAFVSLLAFYYALTPSAWGEPWMNLPRTFATFSNFARLNASTLFEGKLYPLVNGSLPRYYIALWIAITTPFFLLGLMVVGQLAAIKDWVKQPKEIIHSKPLWFVLLCTLTWGGPMLYFMITQPIVYNAWRHFYFLYVPLILLAIYGIRFLGTLLKPKGLKTAGCLVLASCLTFTAVGMIQNHPYQHVYFNALAGDAERMYLGDYWYVSLGSAMEKLISSPDRNQSLPLTVSGFEKARLEALTYTKRQVITVLDDPFGESASYIVINPSYQRAFFGLEGYEELRQQLSQNYHELFSLKSYGHVIMTILERNEASH